MTECGGGFIKGKSFLSLFTDCPENVQYNIILFTEMTFLCFIYRYQNIVLIASILLFNAFFFYSVFQESYRKFALAVK